jgi:DNA-binding MarR family transcriptional regulator
MSATGWARSHRSEDVATTVVGHDIIDVMSERGTTIYGLLRLVRPIVLNSARVVEAEVHALGWTVGSRAVMEALESEAPLTVPQIAVRLSLARQNVQRHVDELIRLDHLHATPNPAHRRSVLIQPTAQGREAFRTLHARELADLADLAHTCSNQDLQTAAQVLRALDHDIRDRANGTKRPPQDRR